MLLNFVDKLLDSLRKLGVVCWGGFTALRLVGTSYAVILMTKLQGRSPVKQAAVLHSFLSREGNLNGPGGTYFQWEWLLYVLSDMLKGKVGVVIIRWNYRTGITTIYVWWRSSQARLPRKLFAHFCGSPFSQRTIRCLLAPKYVSEMLNFHSRACSVHKWVSSGDF